MTSLTSENLLLIIYLKSAMSSRILLRHGGINYLKINRLAVGVRNIVQADIDDVRCPDFCWNSPESLKTQVLYVDTVLCTSMLLHHRRLSAV